MSRLLKVVVEDPETGWSDWLLPKMQGYKMTCCDCGLVHDLDFKVVKVMEEAPDKSVRIQDIEKSGKKELLVSFRARRNTRSTGQSRRWKKERKP